jgi:hypothetical protein
MSSTMDGEQIAKVFNDISRKCSVGCVFAGGNAGRAMIALGLIEAAKALAGPLQAIADAMNPGIVKDSRGEVAPVNDNPWHLCGTQMEQAGYDLDFSKKWWCPKCHIEVSEKDASRDGEMG